MTMTLFYLSIWRSCRDIVGDVSPFEEPAVLCPAMRGPGPFALPWQTWAFVCHHKTTVLSNGNIQDTSHLARGTIRCMIKWLLTADDSHSFNMNCIQFMLLSEIVAVGTDFFLVRICYKRRDICSQLFRVFFLQLFDYIISDNVGNNEGGLWPIGVNAQMMCC